MKKVLISAFLVLVAACGDADTVPTTPPPALPTGADEIVLRIFVRANQPDPLSIARAFPEFTLYGDGRLITIDRDAEPGLLGALEEAYLTPEGIRLLAAEWVAAGALEPLDGYGFTGVLDGDSTRFYIGTEPPVSFSVSDLGSRPGGPGADVTDEQLAARETLTALRSAMRSYEDLVGREIVSGPSPLAPDRVAIVGMPFGVGGESDFPFDVTGLGERVETRVSPTTCLVVDGPDLETLLDTLDEAASLAPWRIDGRQWALVFRPMLPDEAGCAVLAEQ